jgi:hypothetical protein
MNSFTKGASTGTLSEPAHDPDVTTPADHAVSVVPVGRTRPLT